MKKAPKQAPQNPSGLPRRSAISPEDLVAFRRLYPELSEEEAIDAAERVDRYLEVVAEIADRQMAEGKPALPTPEERAERERQDREHGAQLGRLGGSRKQSTP